MKPLARTFSACTDEAARIEPSFLSFSSRDLGHNKKEDFMGEATDPEKIAEQAKEHIAGAAEDLKATASPIADATRPAAEAAWNDAKREIDRLHSICEGYIKEKPIQTLLVLFGIGILVGLVVRR